MLRMFFLWKPITTDPGTLPLRLAWLSFTSLMSSSHMVSTSLQIVSVMLVDSERQRSSYALFPCSVPCHAEVSRRHPVQHLLKTGVP